MSSKKLSWYLDWQSDNITPYDFGNDASKQLLTQYFKIDKFSINLFFSKITPNDLDKIKKIDLEEGCGKIYIDTKSHKIIMIKLFQTLKSNIKSLPVVLDCRYSHDSDCLYISVVDKGESAVYNGSIPGNKELFNYDLLLDICDDERVSGIEFIGATDLLTK